MEGVNGLLTESTCQSQACRSPANNYQVPGFMCLWINSRVASYCAALENVSTTQGKDACPPGRGDEHCLQITRPDKSCAVYFTRNFRQTSGKPDLSVV